MSSSALGERMRVTGREFISSIVIPVAGFAADGIVYNRLNVAAPSNTRLAQYATIYERWHCRKYRYHFTSALPTSTGGTIILAQEPDPTTVFLSGAGLTAQLRVLPGSVVTQVWQNASCDLASSGDYTSLWTSDPDMAVTDGDRLDLAGQLIIACAAAGGSTLVAGNEIGFIELEYDIEFFVPRLSTAGGSSRTTCVKVTKTDIIASGTTPIIPSQPILAASNKTTPGTVPFVDNFINSMKATIAQSGQTLFSDVLIPQLKNYVSAASMRRAGLRVPPTSGWPQGKYTIEITCYSNTYPAATYLCTNAAFASVPTTYSGMYQTNVDATHGDSSGPVTAIESPANALRDPQGNSWKYGEVLWWTLEIGAGASRGYADYSIQSYVALASLPSDFVLYVKMTSAAPSTSMTGVVVPGGSPMGIERAIPWRPDHESDLRSAAQLESKAPSDSGVDARLAFAKPKEPVHLVIVEDEPSPLALVKVPAPAKTSLKGRVSS
jgi:hypothetical protein